MEEFPFYTLNYNQMKQNCPQSSPSFRLPFLQKFAGKLNTITKHGHITNQTGFKLPLISTLNCNRSNTVIMRNPSTLSHSISSQGIRGLPSKSSIRNPGGSTHFMKSKSKVFTDVSNSFLKIKPKANHGKSISTQSVFGLLIGTSESRLLVSQRPDNFRAQNKFLERQRLSQLQQLGTHLEEVKKTAWSKRYFI